MPATLKKSTVLRGRNVFHKLFTEGKTLSSGAIRCFYASAENTPGGTQVGFTVTRNARKAVTRNRIKRLMKESWRRRQGKLRSPGARIQIVFLYSKYSETKRLKLEDIDGMMQELVEKLNKTTT